MLNLQSSAYNIRSGGEGQYEFFADISTRSLLTVRVGESAGKISTGSGNAFVGYEAGKQNMEGSFGTFVGFQAGSLNQYGNYCTYVGAFAGVQNRNGDANTFVGYRAGELNKDGSECVGVGAYTLRENYSGNRIVAVGYRAAERTLDGDFNTMIGAESGQDNRSGNFNTMAGFRSGRASFRGNENTYFGAYAGYSNSLGDGNAFIGYKAGEYLQDGGFNVAVGAYALQRAEHGDCNIAIGAYSGSVATGSGSVYVGTNAGASNVSGDYNVYLGSDTGAKANGSENVYIGKSAASNLQGNQNVVIGAYTMLDRQTNGTVVIGYRIGENFQTGQCNVFIGYGVDTHDIANSFGIAIGTRNVKTYHNSIAIGQQINNSANAGVMIGRAIVSDAENSIAIGNDIDVSSVYVLADRLDFRFPLNASKTYDFFNLQESYTDTIFDGIRSNTSAIFAVNSSNLFNSGDNRIPIPIPTFDSNLLNLFYSHIMYQGKVIPLYTVPTTLCNLTMELNMASNIRVQNGVGLPFIPSSNVIFANEQNKLYAYPITVRFTGHPYSVSPTSKLGTLGINLIKKDDDVGQSNVFTYSYYFPKRYPIYSLQQYGYQSNIITPSRFELIRNTSNIESWNFNLWNYETSVDGYDTGLYGSYPTDGASLSNVVLQQPLYGLLTSNLYTYSPNITYTPFPESLFASQDQFTIYPARRINNQLLLSDRSNVITLYSSNIERFNSNVIFLHPYRETTIDRSHLLRKPIYDPSTSVQFQLGTNMTLKKNNVAYVTNPVTTTYQDIINQSLTLSVTDSNISMDAQLQATIGADDYSLSIFYADTSNYINDYTTSNIIVTVPTSNVLVSVNLPSLSANSIYVRTYPTYGILTVPENATNTNQITYQSYHPTKQDTCQLLIQYPNGDRIDYKVLEYTFIRNQPNIFFSVPLYKVQDSPYTVAGATTQLILLNIEQQNQPLLTTITDSTTVTVTNAGGSTPPTLTSQTIQYTCNVFNYIPNLQYLETSNITKIHKFNKISYAGLSISDKNKVPLPTPWDGQACNIYYYKYTSENPIVYPSTTGSYNINITNSNYTQTYSLFFYGVTSPYYEYETITGATNVYWEYRKQIRIEGFYDFASNLFINNSNNIYQSSRYYSAQDQTALYFESNIQVPIVYPPNSNNRLSTLSGENIYKIYSSNFAYYLETAKYINAFPLLDKNFYQYNASYQYQQINSNISIVQKDVGIVQQFYQSNVTNKEIYLWVNSNLTSNNPYESHRIQFGNQRYIDLNYYSNVATPASLDQAFAFQTSNYISQTLDGNQTSPDYNFVNQANTYIGIQALTDGCIVYKNTYELTNKIDYASVAQYAFIPLVRSNLEPLQYFYVDKTTTPNKAQSVVKKPIQIDSRITHPIYMNQGLSDTKNYLTENHSYVTYNQLYPNEVVYKILAHSNDFNQTQFTQKDLQDGHIFIYTSNTSGRYEVPYELVNQVTLQPFSSGTFTVQNYKQTIFPSVQSGLNSSNEIIQIQQNYAHNLIGPLWNSLTNSFQNVTYVDSNELYLHMVRNPSKGYFYSSNTTLNQSTNVRQRFTYHQFKTDKIHYIPYQPMELSNETYQFYLEYRGDISEVYTTTVKNYWSKFPPILTDSSRVINDTYKIKLDALPRSVGFIQDGYIWSSNGSSLMIKGYSVPKITEERHFTERPYFKTSNVTKALDSGGFYNFSDLTNYVVSSNSRDLHFFVSSNPSYGCILKEAVPDNSNFKYVASPYFNYTDLVNQKVFYHHYGENSTTENFSLIVGSLQTSDSNIYDVSEQALQYTITIQDKPQLTKNNPDYVYKLTTSNILNDYNLIPNTLIQITKGNISIFQTSNLDFYRKDNGSYIPSTFFTKTELDTNKVYYKFNSNVFQNNSNVNQPNTIQYILTSQSNVTGFIDPISTLPYYSGLYLQDWKTYLNQYISSNVIQYPLNSNQVVQYAKRSFDSQYVSFDGRRVEIDFTLNPRQQQLYVNTGSDTFPHNTYLDQVTTLSFDFKIQDQNNQNLFKAYITKKSMTLYDSSNVASSLIPITLNMNQANNIRVILQDDRNNDAISFYINNTNYLAGLNYDPKIPSTSNIKTFMIQANIEDPNNYYNYVLTSNISPNVYLYYNLINFSNRLLFNDFNILVNTYDQAYRENTTFDDNTFSSNVHNVIIGKILDVKGLNNICIGKNFRTVGTDSIIVGNNIGVNELTSATTTLNEIFGSIVVANNSFINSKVRDTIAIGNNILSNIDPTLVDMNNFLRKKPVLVGNDITTNLIDFHINFQNTLLKTSESPAESIYLGLNQEVVGIGYTQNQQLTNTHQLYVNGGISARSPITIGGELTSVRKLYGNMVFTSGTSHSASIPISWTITQGDDYGSFLVTGKFRGLLNDTETLFKRFETWVTPKDDSTTSKPKGLVNYEIANYTTAGISGFSHTITRDTATSANLIITWTTTATLTTTQKMIAHLDLEVSYPETLGKITLGTITIA